MSRFTIRYQTRTYTVRYTEGPQFQIVRNYPSVTEGGGPPTGGAGGFLSGSYPNPGVNTEALQDAVGAMAGTGLSYDDTTGVINADGGEVFVVTTQSAMLALDAQQGDVAKRTDISATFMLSTNSPGTLGDWVQVTFAADVESVNGQTGVIVLAATDVGADPAGSATTAQAAAVQRANHTGTQAISTVSGLQTALDGKSATGHGHATSDVAGLDAALAGKASATRTVGTGLGTSGTVDLDMAALHGTIQKLTATGSITFTSSNRAAGREVTLVIAAGGSSRTLAWPSWIAVGAALPTALASGKTLVVTVTFTDTTEAAAIAAAAVQP